jgi:predicted RNase H-like HicB family nuclease
MSVLEDTFESITVMVREVARDPQSPAASYSVLQSVQNIDQFLASSEMRTILQLDPSRRPVLPESFSTQAQRLFASLWNTHSVAVQIEQLGGHVPWSAELEGAIGRLERAFAELGVNVDRSSMPPSPIVTRSAPGEDGRPAIRVATTVVRRPQLEPYIAAALRAARVRELQPGRWYADLASFPGAWADGTSAEECLATLADVLHEWLIVKVILGDRDVPVLGDLDPRALVLG